MRTVIYPGTFDPITNGHLDVIERAARLFDRVIVAVAQSDSKQPLFTLEERRRMVEKATTHMKNVEVDSFTCLLIDYAAKKRANAIIRGLRAVSDFEFEFQLALTNRRMNPQIETIFLMPRETFTFLSSRMVKEICRLGGDVRHFVPPHVDAALRQKFGFARTRPSTVKKAKSMVR